MKMPLVAIRNVVNDSAGQLIATMNLDTNIAITQASTIARERAVGFAKCVNTHANLIGAVNFISRALPELSKELPEISHIVVAMLNEMNKILLSPVESVRSEPSKKGKK